MINCHTLLPLVESGGLLLMGWSPIFGGSSVIAKEQIIREEAKLGLDIHDKFFIF